MSGIDRDALHRLLWLRQGTGRRMAIDQNGLARDLGINKFSMSRIMRRMTEEGRVEPVTANGGGMSRVWAVVDPDGWAPPPVEGTS